MTPLADEELSGNKVQQTIFLLQILLAVKEHFNLNKVAPALTNTSKS